MHGACYCCLLLSLPAGRAHPNLLTPIHSVSCPLPTEPTQATHPALLARRAHPTCRRQLISLSFAGMGLSMLLMAAGLALPFLSGDAGCLLGHARCCCCDSRRRRSDRRRSRCGAAARPAGRPRAPSCTPPCPLCFPFHSVGADSLLAVLLQVWRAPLRWWAPSHMCWPSRWEQAPCRACWCPRSRRRASGVSPRCRQGPLRMFKAGVEPPAAASTRRVLQPAGAGCCRCPNWTAPCRNTEPPSRGIEQRCSFL